MRMGLRTTNLPNLKPTRPAENRTPNTTGTEPAPRQNHHSIRRSQQENLQGFEHRQTIIKSIQDAATTRHAKLTSQDTADWQEILITQLPGLTTLSMLTVVKVNKN